MSSEGRLWHFRERLPASVQGPFYIDDQCLDCDLCRETAPMLFARNDDEGRSFLFKQPENDAELALARGALEGCCTEAIHDDGDDFDWVAHPAMKPYNQLTPEQQKVRIEEENRVFRRIPFWRRFWTFLGQFRDK